MGPPIQSDASTAISQAPHSPPAGVRQQMDHTMVHHCSSEDAAEALRHMPARKQYLVRKWEDSEAGRMRWYKVSVRERNAPRSEVYEESMLMSMMRQSPEQFVSVRDTIQTFHHIRTPPKMRIQGGGSLFLHPSDMSEENVKRHIQRHYARNQHTPELRRLKHVLLRSAPDRDGKQWVDAFYTQQGSADRQRLEIFTKSMPLVKAASRFMNVVAIPTVAKLGGGGGRPDVDADDVSGEVPLDPSNEEEEAALEVGGIKDNFQRKLNTMSGDQAFTLGSELLQKERQKMVAAQGEIDRTEQGIIDIRNERIITDGTNAELMAELESDQVRLEVQKEAMQDELQHLEKTFAQKKDHLQTAIRRIDDEKKSVHNSFQSNTERYRQHQKSLNDHEKQLMSENSAAVERKTQALAGVTAAQAAAEAALGKEAASEQAKARYFQQEFDTRAAEAELLGPPNGFAATPGTTEPIYTPTGEYYLATPADPGSAEAGLGNVDSTGGDRHRTLEAYGSNYHTEQAKRLRDINEGKQFSGLAQEGDLEENVQAPANDEDQASDNDEGQGSGGDDESNSSISSESLQEVDDSSLAP